MLRLEYDIKLLNLCEFTVTLNIDIFIFQTALLYHEISF